MIPTEFCIGPSDTRTALAAMAQVFATFAALGGGFGILRFQALATKQEALERRFFGALRDLVSLSGESADPDMLRSAGTYLPFEAFVQKGIGLLHRAYEGTFPDAPVPGPKTARVQHASVAFHGLVRKLRTLPRERNRALWLTVVPVLLNGIACAVSLCALLSPPFCRLLTEAITRNIGQLLVLVVVVLVVGVTVLFSVLLLFDLRRQAGEKPVEGAQ
jgi:hypothetical protein